MIRVIAKKDLDDLAQLIYAHPSVVNPNYVVGWYRYWALTEALQEVLLDRNLISEDELERAVSAALERMKADFR